MGWWVWGSNFNVVRAVMIFIVEAETGGLWRLICCVVVGKYLTIVLVGHDVVLIQCVVLIPWS